MNFNVLLSIGKEFTEAIPCWWKIRKVNLENFIWSKVATAVSEIQSVPVPSTFSFLLQSKDAKRDFVSNILDS